MPETMPARAANGNLAEVTSSSHPNDDRPDLAVVDVVRLHARGRVALQHTGAKQVTLDGKGDSAEVGGNLRIVIKEGHWSRYGVNPWSPTRLVMQVINQSDESLRFESEPLVLLAFEPVQVPPTSLPADEPSLLASAPILSTRARSAKLRWSTGSPTLEPGAKREVQICWDSRPEVLVIRYRVGAEDAWAAMSLEPANERAILWFLVPDVDCSSK